MARLPRPSIPIEAKCRVALRQLGEMFIDQVIEEHRAGYTVAPAYRRTHGKLLVIKLDQLSTLLGCEIRDLRLDHNPALGVRTKIRNRFGEIVAYDPEANDPEFLIYRTSHAHHIKTNVRGDGAQFSDTVLMKRERRRQKKLARRKPIRGNKPRPSAKIPARKNPWPPKGSRRWQR